MNKQTFEMIERLRAAGIASDDAFALRRIAMTLHRWHELECGDNNKYVSWCITRGHKKNGAFTHDDDGASYLEVHSHSGRPTSYQRIPDRERGAQKRLAAIVARYPGFQAYVQGDPRGAALYILHPNDIVQGADLSSCYNRGIAVYK